MMMMPTMIALMLSAASSEQDRIKQRIVYYRICV